MTAPVLVVADLHGRTDSLEELLRWAGALNPDGSRCGEVVTVQLGDLANLAADEPDEPDVWALELGERWFDVQLVGNHEHPLWGGPRFAGYGWSEDAAEVAARRAWVPSFWVEELDLLVTHAGWGRDLDVGVGDYAPESALEADAFLRQLWERDPVHYVFSAIGRSRGGRSDCGGVLWADWAEAKLPAFNQLVGHTTGPEVRQREHPASGTWALCVDANAKRHGTATGVLVDPGAGTVDTVTVGGDAPLVRRVVG